MDEEHPMTTDHHVSDHTDPAELYRALKARQEAAWQRRIASGTARYSDLGTEEKREYKRRRQAERRAKIKERERSGQANLDVETVRSALADAVLLALAAGDERAEPFLQAAARVFEIPEAAEATIRGKAKRLKPRVLTSERFGVSRRC